MAVLAVYGVAAIVAVLTTLAIWLVIRLDPDWLNDDKQLTGIYQSIQRPVHQLWNEPGGKVRIATWLAPVALILIISIIPPLWPFFPELVGISFGVLVIDELAIHRQNLQFKQSIIRQMASLSNDFALDAARIVVDNKWHTDGSLKQANLGYANLCEVKLWSANLQDARMWSTKLRNAQLMYADLRGAILLDARLQGANLSDAKLQGAMLDYADFRGAILDRAEFTGAVYTQATRWSQDGPPAGALNWDVMTAEDRDAWRKTYGRWGTPRWG